MNKKTEELERKIQEPSVNFSPQYHKQLMDQFDIARRH